MVNRCERRATDDGVYIILTHVYTLSDVTKRLIDIDDAALRDAQAHLGTATIKDTVNQALRLAAEERRLAIADALATLARADLADRAAAWR